MKFEDVKVGQILRHTSGTNTYKVLLKNATTNKIVVEASSDGDVYIFGEAYLGRYSIKPEFFKEGKTYKSKTRPSGAYEILSVHTVPNPDYEEDALAAVALFTNGSTGKQHIVQFTLAQFGYYEEA